MGAPLRGGGDSDGLRSMLRPERQTVAMDLAAALHHSRDVGLGTNDGLRAQTTASSGKRPGVLTEPEPQGGAVTVGYVAAPVPTLALSVLAGSAGEAVDDRSLRFLLGRSLAEKEEEEEEEKRRKEKVEFCQASLARARELYGSKRKRKKRRKRRTPQTSSRSLHGGARRQKRQWHVSGSPGDVLLVLCSLRSSTGLRCLASWPIWTRRTVAVACSRYCWFLCTSCCVPFPG